MFGRAFLPTELANKLTLTQNRSKATVVSQWLTYVLSTLGNFFFFLWCVSSSHICTFVPLSASAGKNHLKTVHYCVEITYLWKHNSSIWKKKIVDDMIMDEDTIGPVYLSVAYGDLFSESCITWLYNWRAIPMALGGIKALSLWALFPRNKHTLSSSYPLTTLQQGIRTQHEKRDCRLFCCK